MIQVDTSVWIDLLRGIDTPESLMLQRLIADDEEISICELILTEILQGIKSDREFRNVKGYLLEFPVFRPTGIETYIRAAQIYRKCRKKGKTVRKTVDCIIAAICMENNLSILHRDNDFNIIAQCTSLNILKADAPTI